MSKYRIEDWAGNILDVDGTFKRSQLAVPIKFDSFEDGWGHLHEKYADNEEAQNDEHFFDDVGVYEIEEK